MERKSMPSTHDVLDEARDIMQRRLNEIDDERKRLERALAELGGKAKRSPGRPRGSSASTAAPKATSSTSSSAATPTRRRRRRRGGTRADQAVDLIASQPGISASDVAKTMKIKPNYLYRVLGDLEKEGRVKKDGRQYYPTATAKSSDE
jgi:sugar-specific transcriptional regulator TrmB